MQLKCEGTWNLMTEL